MMVSKRLKEGARDRSLLVVGAGIGFAVIALYALVKAILGQTGLQWILFGLVVFTGLVVWRTWERFKASGLKPPTLRELREMERQETEQKTGRPE
ncbi:hypothetical protein [Microvirga tunisiensis]|uniref:Uncharacterized protein n=1 Tax=Microvirga tunisiensis TaxID=2108360 RepID=A0A5N7MAT4_9HYPH|nr:hypothetical protein [Microvirga tunisiensis]MPR05667.1 hypothetical protein [Microvirga tunisiensis]MPR23867.1 hypothetical protein [Microvirga tunisiensis]